MCAGTSAGDYDHPTPELRPEHLTGISFSETTYLEPWAIYTVKPGVVNTGRAARATVPAPRRHPTRGSPSPQRR
jgi:hypothetical protein